jgi:hypothetical protein
VWWAIGSRTRRTGAAGGSRGCWGLLTTLGEWVLPKTRRQGVAWNVGVDSRGVSEVMAACGGGLKVVLGAGVGLVLGVEGETTLGESRKFTRGLAGAGWWFSRRDGGASQRHDSKIS